MAFKILSSNEIELLAENQRKSYEEELAVYNERVKFVEQMEKFENTVIAPYEPKLVNILDVGKAPEKTYSNPAYVVKMADLTVKSVPEIATVNFDEPVAAVVPKYSKIKNVPIEHIKKVEQNRPILPQAGKVAAPVSTFVKSEPQAFVLPERVKTIVPSKISKKIEHARPDLPTAVKPKSFAKLAFAPVHVDNNAIKANCHNVRLSAVNLPALTLPEKAQPILPKLLVTSPEVKAFEVPEQAVPVLPRAIIPDKVSASFSKPNVQHAKLPITQKAVIPTRKFVKSEYVLSDLPTAIIPKAGVQSYIAPQIQKSDLPTFVKPVVTSRPYIKPIVNSTLKIEYPPININYVKPLKKISSKISNLPRVNAVVIPDAYAKESLKNLLPSNRGNETREGAFA